MQTYLCVRTVPFIALLSTCNMPNGAEAASTSSLPPAEINGAPHGGRKPAKEMTKGELDSSILPAGPITLSTGVQYS